MPVGFTEGVSLDEERPNWNDDGPRPLKWSVWYPAVESECKREPTGLTWFQNGSVIRDAGIRNPGKPYSLVFLSHGTGGVAASLGWLGRQLAQNGFIAVALNHHGNTAAEPYRAEGFLCLWERARDLSVLLADIHLQKRFNVEFASRAYVAGFSAGAYAAMLLMGARVAYSQFEAENPVKSPIRGPIEFPDLADQIPMLLDRSAVFRASWERRRANYKDGRFCAALVMAPGRSVLGFSPLSLAQIESEIHILVGDGDNIAPEAECSRWLHSHVKSSHLEIIGGGAGHYVFLSEPTPLGLKEAPYIFCDPQTVDRKAVHEQASLTAIRHFGGSS